MSANTGTRVNLTLPPESDAALTRLAAAAGVGKATFIREWLGSMLPQLQQLAEAMELAKSAPVDAIAIATGAVREATAKAKQTELQLGQVKRRAMQRVRKRKS